MKRKKVRKKILTILIPVSILLILSLLNIYGSYAISSLYHGSVFRQLLWILVSIIMGLIVYRIDMRFFLRYIKIFYILGSLSLLLVLFMGSNINGSSSWFRFGPFSIQPSEVFKFFFLIFISSIASNQDKDFIKFIKIIIFTFVPSILIFLEPDTGVVLMYLLIMVGVILGSNIKKRYFTTIFIVGVVSIVSFFLLYYLKKDLFISIFGSSFFYRIDRLLDFKNNTSYQLNNALIGLGATPLLGFGITHPKIYVPEITTDFAFDLSIFNFGYLVGIIIVLIYMFMLFTIYRETKRVNTFNRCILLGIFCLMSYQIFEHILMNLGLTPITGITLPFLSYGGSSMLSYALLFSLILKITTNSSSYNLD